MPRAKAPLDRLAVTTATLFIGGLALRPQLVGIGPVVERIQLDLGITYGIAGLLGTIPIFLMGLMALASPFLHGIAGVRWTVGLSLVGIAAFGLLRPSAGDALSLLIFTVPVGVAIGIAGAMLPAAVSEQRGLPAGVGTAVYALGVQIGAAVSASLAVPIAVAGGGWQAPLVAYGIFNGVAAVLWLFLWPTRRGRLTHAASRPIGSTRRAVPLVVVFAIQSFAYYATVAWLPAALGESGWSEAAAGGALGLLNLAAIAGTLLMTGLARSSRNRVFLLAFAALMLSTGLSIIVTTPDLGLWGSLVAGFSFGMMFPIVLTLPLDIASSSTQAIRLSAAMLGLGYLVSAFAPPTMGMVRDFTGSFGPMLWILVSGGVVLAGLSIGWRQSALKPHRVQPLDSVGST